MSPQYSYHHLSDILELYPDEEPYCAGYAPSQKRRCHASTNARNRSNARRLLDQGTSMLQAGQCIDNLLYNLAPLVLCTRWHQGQASNLAHQWSSQVRGYLGEQNTRQSTPVHGSWHQPQLQPQPQFQPQTAYLDTGLSNRLAELERKVQAAQKEAEKARRREERAKREAERIRQDTESLVRRSVAMGFARGQEEAGRNAVGVHTAATVTGQVDGTRRGSQMGGLMASSREDARGRGVEVTTRTSTTTTNTNSTTTRGQITGDEAATSAQTGQRTISAASVSDANNNSNSSNTPATSSPVEQRTVNARSVSSTADTSRTSSTPVTSSSNEQRAVRAASVSDANNSNVPAASSPASSASSTPDTSRTSSTPGTSFSAEQRAVSAGSISSTVDTNTTSASATPSPAEQGGANSSASPSPSSTSDTSSTDAETPNTTATSATQETPNPPVPIIQTQPPLTPPPSFSPLPPRPTSTISAHGTTRQPIDGDCCICIFPLKEGPPNHNHNPNDTDLVWCQKQCGVNIHRSCMDEWVASSLSRNRITTCPMCRARW
ncbi:hypothetical protein BO78DRAFT_211625 [Aspergillus sclerotiicarbonarius CBS 121057]|uniref:RING-type domain-containing protein n=1 Tax=Aspergillus sclerotiicarbonarius (strain CBS 121057 / IBT 28362) TaxID=1448318 RepID=A0A319DYP1_ASPSB|nr:hypothetical protein BO78DRAFT_211625 [Aspergillus sclerotiicarbonarius CBS 121057]